MRGKKKNRKTERKQNKGKRKKERVTGTRDSGGRELDEDGKKEVIIS